MPSASIRERVSHARFVQLKRFGDQSKVTCNARMTPRLLRKYCALDLESMELLKEAVTSLSLSARAYDRILKVALRIAAVDFHTNFARHRRSVIWYTCQHQGKRFV